jgi:hypothetical protein
MSTTAKITGHSLPAGEFRVAEFHDRMDPNAVQALLDGRLAAAVLYDGMAAEDCRALCERFRRVSDKTVREGAAQGAIVGAYHYGSTADEYLQAVDATSASVAEVLGSSSPVELVLEIVRGAVEPFGQTVQLAAHGPKIAAEARVASWATPGKYILDPHEDISQLAHPDLAELEISAAHALPVVAANVYAALPPDGGSLRIWNIDPDQNSRRRHGVEHTGYYYPEDALDGIAFVDVAPATGSIVLLNARLIHAVFGYGDNRERAASRLSVNFLMSRLRPDTVVYWA